MYSILLKVTTNSSDRWKYLYNDDGSLYQDDDLGRVRQKVIELLSDHVLSAIKVVANKRAVSHIVIEGNPDEPGQWLPEVTINDNGKVLMVIDGEWDKGEIEVGNVLPDVTVDDNGKVLKVVEGEWAAAEESGGTDENVKQVPTNAENNTYELLFSNSANNTEETGVTRKSQYFTFNPSKKAFTCGTRANDSTIGNYSFAEGLDTTASGTTSHAEGYLTIASGSDAHAEGQSTTASGPTSHAEGNDTIASDNQSHAEGFGTVSSGAGSHSEGGFTVASGMCSHAEGYETIAKFKNQHVFGEYNIEDPYTSQSSNVRGNYVEIIGNGTTDGTTETRSNARTLDWSGNEWLAGNLTTTDVIKKTGTWDGTNANLSLVITSLINRINTLEGQLANLNVISNSTIDEICV